MYRVGEGVAGELCKNQETRALQCRCNTLTVCPFGGFPDQRAVFFFLHLHAFLLAWCAGIWAGLDYMDDSWSLGQCLVIFLGRSSPETKMSVFPWAQ